MCESGGRPSRDPVVAEYSRLAPVYDARWSFYVESTVRETMARFSLCPAARVLDVGCGTGTLLEALADRYPQAELLGIDPVPGMLAAARRRLPAKIRLQRGRAEALPFGDECFDTIVSCSVFHYIRQPLAALQEMHRVLRPAGRIVITDWCGDTLSCRILDRYLRWFNAAHYKTYPRHELMELLRAAGFSRIEVERYRISRFWALMTARGEK